LTFRGLPVGTTFGFGLSARSFAVVPFNHFWDPHLTQYALPQQEARHVLRQTVASTSFAGSNNRLVNAGLPPARVMASTGLGIRRVTLYDSQVTVNGAGAEKLQPGSAMLAVVRPSFPHAMNQPAAAGWVNNNADRKPNPGLGSSSTYLPRHLTQAAAQNGASEVTPRGALIYTGRKQTTSGQTFTYSGSRGTPQTSPGTYQIFPRRDAFPNQPTVASELLRSSSPASPHPKPAVIDPPLEALRPAPAPAYSPPPRTEVIQSHPVYSPPPAPAAPSEPAWERRGR
jgi:hypothetical protein